MLDTLLGPDWKVEDAARSQLPLNGPVLGDLSPETKQAVRDIVARAQRQGQNGAGSGRPEAQIRADLAKTLTPAQLEEFLLRYSSAAAGLRSQLHDFEVTPEQFRKMFDLRDPIAQQLQAAKSSDLPAQTQAFLEKQLNDAILTVLGPEQYPRFPAFAGS